MSVLIKNGFVLTQNEKRELKSCDVFIDEGRISEMGEVKVEADHVIDAKDKVVMPGLINTHNHVANTIIRGYADDVHLEQMLEKTFSMDSKITRRDVQVGSLVGCLEMIKSGTTSFVDLFYWEDEIAKAVHTSGMRGFLSWAVLDKEFTTQKGNPLDNCEEFIENHKGKERITPMVSLMGVYVSSEETFLKGKDLASKYGTMCHLHLSETRKEVYDNMKKHSARPVEWLEKIGFLNENVLAAHCAWLTIGEVRTLAKRKVKVSHCPVSNMKLATGGIAPVLEMLENGVTVSLGTDSCVSNNDMDMFETMKFASLFQKASRWDPTVLKAQKVLDLATIEGARALGMEKELGSIEEGKIGDIAIVNLKTPNAVPFYPDLIPSHLVYSCNGGNVDTVIVDGRPIMKDRILSEVDESSVLEEFQELAMAVHGVSR
jgi:5-methylthioadenosine/S-adenosylhomocysteine deaminase